MKTLLATVFTIIFFTLSAQTDVDFQYDQSIKFHPVALSYSGYQISYERYFDNRKRSFVATPTLMFKEGSQESRTGAELMGQYRFYLTHLNRVNDRTFWNIYNFGFYAGVYGLGYYLDETYLDGFYNYDTNEYESSHYDLKVRSVEIGTVLGMQIDFTRRIVLDLNIGGGLRKSDVEDSFLNEDGDLYFEEYSPFDPSYTGVKAKLNLSIGITL